MFNEIIAQLKEKYNQGATPKEIANEAGCSHQYISRLLNGTLDPANMSLRTFSKLFPDAQIVFGGDRRIGDVHHNTNSPVIQGDGNTVAAQPSEETASAFLQRIMAAPDIDAETKVKIFNLHSRRPFN
jgi:hypothetical protein